MCLDALAEQPPNCFLSEKEERAHFALWAILKSPLMISADLRRLAHGAVSSGGRRLALRCAGLNCMPTASMQLNGSASCRAYRCPLPCSIRPSSLAVLKAKEIIAVNQDALGVAGDLIWKQGPKEVG